MVSTRTSGWVSACGSDEPEAHAPGRSGSQLHAHTTLSRRQPQRLHRPWVSGVWEIFATAQSAP